MTVMAETRQLSLHPLAIHTFIKAQAGSLGKAMSEAVMNSIDAFARNIVVTVTASGFTIEDDGQGFRSRDEIAAWFETLGFPHDDGNHRVYGKFGMGRAQMWAYAKTVWRSNQFVMSVDVKSKGLDYELEETASRFKGTRIEATFYTPISFQQQEMVAMELTNLVRYAPALVSINGKAVSKDPSVEEWTLETPEAWMRFDKSMHSLDVYNGGILVAHFPRYRFGCSGVVVTKPDFTLSLNLARNDILEAECKVWPKIVKHLPKPGAENAKKAPKADKPSARTLQAVAGEVAAGTQLLRDAMDKYPGLIVSVYGRALKFSDLGGRWRGTTVVAVPKGDDFGKRLSKLRRATTVARESLELLGLKSVMQLRALVQASIEAEAEGWSRKHALDSLAASTWSDDAPALFPDLSEGKEVFLAKDLSEQAAAARMAWVRAWAPCRRQLLEAARGHAGLHNRLGAACGVMVGDCPTRMAWLSDGGELVLREADLLKAMPQSMPLLTRYVSGVLLEVLRNEASTPAEGQDVFLKVMTESDTLGRLVLALTQCYIRECRARDLPVPTTKLADLDAIGAE